MSLNGSISKTARLRAASTSNQYSRHKLIALNDVISNAQLTPKRPSYTSSPSSSSSSSLSPSSPRVNKASNFYSSSASKSPLPTKVFYDHCVVKLDDGTFNIVQLQDLHKGNQPDFVLNSTYKWIKNNQVLNVVIVAIGIIIV